mmetsp:Transcript_47472/g.101532  ORF Transcript_47472/g.101532 Transcript_47472/m.101532 type:complete len:615 (+) Transcript_47472:128-1972(+)|eukprot:CAMPEP_0206465166 /NCGR_PEP_ID=MMETSP0324_2-20121206/27665_1 /ASSEMBLY_ACC=CAM_ASM_000836 /TAXON_ID=2866 /ORGANISM="Crypthecodinium cohnii, Strain Seligo" /LENGTH=614 /DNA_ID=CAMNT_0053937967 /DNA_START=69 /DNA_END=1913 /DNA_ORIENTATION=+
MSGSHAACLVNRKACTIFLGLVSLIISQSTGVIALEQREGQTDWRTDVAVNTGATKGFPDPGEERGVGSWPVAAMETAEPASEAAHATAEAAAAAAKGPPPHIDGHATAEADGMEIGHEPLETGHEGEHSDETGEELGRLGEGEGHEENGEGGEGHEHGEEHGEGHGEGHGGHGEEAVTNTAAASLLGMTASIQLVFYLTNSRFVLVRLMTWRMISAAVSIFAAILIFDLGKTALHVLKIPEYFPCQTLIFVWIWSQVLLYRVKERPLPSVAVATLWGHTTGFFAIAAFGSLQEHYFDTSPGYAMLVVLIAVAVIVALCTVTRVLRNWMALVDDGEVDEIEEEWMEQCQEYEDDVITMALGFLNAQVLRFCAVGELVLPEEDPEVEAMEHVFELQLYGWILFVSMLLATAARAKVHGATKSAEIRRVATIVANLFGMSAAWTLLFGLRWQWISTWAAMFHSRIPAKLLLAACVSIGGVLTILGLNIATKLLNDDFDPKPRTVRAITAATGLLVGLTWENTFGSCIEHLAEQAKGDTNEVMLKGALCIFLLVVVVPSWQWYILPKTDKRLEGLVIQAEEDEEDKQLEEMLQGGGSTSEPDEETGSETEMSQLKTR